MIATKIVRMLVAAGLAVAVLAGPGFAQQQPTPGAIALAKEILTLRSALTVLTPVVSGVVEQARGVFEQQNPALGKDLRDVGAKLRKDLEPRREEIVNVFVKAYAQRFTEQELKELLAFYKTPVGKKVLTEEPIAMEDGFKAAQEWADQLSGTVIEMYRVEMKKKGHNL
jgi:hypothetical protein